MLALASGVVALEDLRAHLREKRSMAGALGPLRS